MKKMFLTMVGATFAFALTAQEITFEKTTHEFGDVDRGGNATYNFAFTNTGSAPLVITGCSTTCGCTTPVCPTDAPIMPGETKSVAVKYNRTDASGMFNRTITVNSNAIASPKVGLTIKGTVK